MTAATGWGEGPGPGHRGGRRGVSPPPRPRAPATPLLVVEEDGGEGVLLYEDRVSTGGTLVVATLDPVYHHGSNFMPAATTCLTALLDWVGTGAREG